MVERASPSRFERRPVLTGVGIAVGSLLLLAGTLELVLRATLDYHIDYYAGVTRPGRVEYPYGPVLINSHGEPDLEWDLADTRPRVGFYGDSVTYGVGAGHGHRLSDLVREARPELQVMTFAAVGARLKDPARVAALAERFGLSALVYVMNLNDVTPGPPRRARAVARPAEAPEPDTPGSGREGAGPAPARGAASAEPPAGEPWLRPARAFFLEHLDGLRNKSYLYNVLRLRVKNLLVRHGFESSGFRAVELEPSRHPEVFDTTAARVREAAHRLDEAGVRFCVLLLPYEMQVSREAAARYRELGVRFEADVVDGRPQRMLRERLPGIPVLDGLEAFVDPAAPAASRAANPLGHYFVYDRGDKIDWNHPTRAGHRRLAELVLERGLCGV